MRKNLLTSLSKVRCKALSLAASEEARRRLRRLFGDDYYETESDNNYIYYDSIIIEGRKLPGLEFVNAQSSKSQETVAIESIDAVQIELDSIFEVIGDSAETKQYIKECVESDNYTRICSLENILNQKFTISSHQSPFTKMKERKSIFTVEDFINTHHAVDTDLANEVKTSELEDVFAHLNYPRPISTQQEEDEFPYSSPSISCPSAPVISPLTKAPKDALLPSVEETNKDSLENSSVSISVSITRKRSKTIKNKYDSDIFRKIVDADDVAASYDREVDFNDASKKNSVNSSEPPRYMKYAGNSSAIDPIRARDLPAFKSNRGDALSGDKKRPVSANGAVRSSSSANGSSNSGANWYHRLATRNDSKQVMKETKRKVRPSSAQKTRTWRLDSAIDDSGTEDCLSPSTNVMFYNHFGLSRDAKQSILSMFDQKEATRFAGESNRAALQETVDNISKLDHLTFDDIAVRKSNALLERYLYATKESSQFAKAPKTPHPLTISREELRAFAPEFDLHATSDVPASDGNAKARLKKKKKKSQKKMDAVRERIKSAYMG